MSYPLAHWRLLISPSKAGALNMAIDEAILEAIGAKNVLPTLRLYAWEPPCLSLGYAQSFLDVDLNRLASLGWHIVRRPTGGRAILHTDELTYSVIGPLEEPRLTGSVLESYFRLSTALLDALHRLEIPARAQTNPVSSESNTPKGPVCFEVPSNYEIIVNGKKLVGSAQARRKEGMLQHGSLPLGGDLTRITWTLAFSDEAARTAASERLLQRATTAEAVLGVRIPWETAAQAFQDAFQSVLNIEFVLSDLTPAESERAEQLVNEKYNNRSWLERV